MKSHHNFKNYIKMQLKINMRLSETSTENCRFLSGQHELDVPFSITLINKLIYYNNTPL